MNTTTEPTTALTPPLPGVEEALRDCNRLELQLEHADDDIETVERRLGDGYKAVAEGADVPRDGNDELTRLLAKRKALQAMLTRARGVLEHARTRAFTRAMLAESDKMRGLLRRREVLAQQAEKQLAALATTLAELQSNGNEIKTAFHALRGRNTQTSKGVVSVEISALADASHLQHLVMQDMARRLRGWRYEQMSPYGGPAFAQGIAGASEAFVSEFDLLMGLDDLDSAEVAAVRCESSKEV